MISSNSKYYIKSTISATQGNGTTFLLSPDFELWQNLETSGNITSLVIRSGTQIERMEITATGWTATIARRGLTQAWVEVEDSSLRKQWTDGSIAYITVLAFDLFDKQGDTMTWPIKFVGGNNEWLVVNNLTTTQRLALSPDNGTIVCDQTIGSLYQFIGGTWSAIAAGSTQPNASTTVAGKVQIPVQATIDSGTDVGSTWALNVVTPSTFIQWIKNFFTTVKSSIIDSDKIWILDSASGTFKWMLYSVLKTQLKTDLPVSNSAIWFAIMATDAIAAIWTDQTTYLNPKQANNNYGLVAIAWTTYTAGASSWNVTTNSLTMVKVKEIAINGAGTYTTAYDYSNSASATGTFRLYKNGVALWTLRTSNSGTPATSTESFAFASGDLVQVYADTSNATWTSLVSNFSVKYAITINLFTWTVNI